MPPLLRNDGIISVLFNESTRALIFLLIASREGADSEETQADVALEVSRVNGSCSGYYHAMLCDAISCHATPRLAIPNSFHQYLFLHPCFYLCTGMYVCIYIWTDGYMYCNMPCARAHCINANCCRRTHPDRWSHCAGGCLWLHVLHDEQGGAVMRNFTCSESRTIIYLPWSPSLRAFLNPSEPLSSSWHNKVLLYPLGWVFKHCLTNWRKSACRQHWYVWFPMMLCHWGGSVTVVVRCSCMLFQN